MRIVTVLLASSFFLAASDELFDAARRGDEAAVKVALDKGAPVDAKWRYDQTALLMAAGRGHAGVVRLLIERGADVNVKDTFYGMTPLSSAVMKGSADVVMLLLDKGATGAEQALLMATGSGKADLVKAMVNRPGWKPETLSRALAAAEAGKKTEVADVLREAGAKPPEEVVVDPATLARYAGRYRDERAEYTVSVKDQKLQVSVGQQALELRAINMQTFEPVQYPGMMTVTFTLDGERCTGFEIQQGSSTQKATRVEEPPK